MDVAAIRTEDLSKHYGDVIALDALDLEVARGEIFGFLGPNGSGKTTTIRLLLNLIRPTRGRAFVLGHPVDDVERVHRHLAYVPGDVTLWPQLTGTETLDLLGNISGGVDAAFRAELLERLHLDPSRRVRSYSKGNRQKVALVAAFMTRPDLLLLDEPTAGLDPLMEAEFQRLAREATARGQTVFLSSHILDEVQDLCDRVGLLREGRLIEVAPTQELRRTGTTVVEVTLSGPPPDWAGVLGVGSVEPVADAERTWRITLTGPPGPLLARLVPAGVERVRTHEPSLEEVFLTYYGTSAAAGGR